MSSEQVVRVPLERVGALVGKDGTVKEEIERKCGVTLDIDGKTGETRIHYKPEALLEANPFKANDIVSAIARGFSPQRGLLSSPGRTDSHADRFERVCLEVRERASSNQEPVDRNRGKSKEDYRRTDAIRDLNLRSHCCHNRRSRRVQNCKRSDRQTCKGWNPQIGL